MPPFQTFWRVTLPLMVPGILAGLDHDRRRAELVHPPLLGSGATMSVEIFTQVFSNHSGTASALASILIVAAVVPLFPTYRVLWERSAVTL